MRIRICAAASVAAAVTFATAAQATVTLYSDAAAFEAALSSSTLEDFTDTTIAPGVSFDCTNCSVDLGSGKLVDQALVGIGQVSRINFATPITAWGANLDESPGGFGRGLFVAIRLTDGFTDRAVGGRLDAYTGQFFGFISDEAFVRVAFFSGNGLGSSERYNLDNMRFGQVRVGDPDPGPDLDPTAVPEPGAWALMIAGFGLAGATLRSRRTVTLA